MIVARWIVNRLAEGDDAGTLVELVTTSNEACKELQKFFDGIDFADLKDRVGRFGAIRFEAIRELRTYLAAAHKLDKLMVTPIRQLEAVLVS